MRFWILGRGSSGSKTEVFMRGFCLRLAKIDSCENKRCWNHNPGDRHKYDGFSYFSLGCEPYLRCFAQSFASVEKTFHNVAGSYLGPSKLRVTQYWNTVIRVFCRIASIRPQMKASERKSLKFMICSEKLATHHLYVYAYAWCITHGLSRNQKTPCAAIRSRDNRFFKPLCIWFQNVSLGVQK